MQQNCMTTIIVLRMQRMVSCLTVGMSYAMKTSVGLNPKQTKNDWEKHREMHVPAAPFTLQHIFCKYKMPLY